MEGSGPKSLPSPQPRPAVRAATRVGGIWSGRGSGGQRVRARKDGVSGLPGLKHPSARSTDRDLPMATRAPEASGERWGTGCASPQPSPRLGSRSRTNFQARLRPSLPACPPAAPPPRRPAQGPCARGAGRRCALDVASLSRPGWDPTHRHPSCGWGAHNLSS